jgi:hypothetical protein
MPQSLFYKGTYFLRLYEGVMNKHTTRQPTRLLIPDPAEKVVMSLTYIKAAIRIYIKMNCIQNILIFCTFNFTAPHRAINQSYPDERRGSTEAVSSTQHRPTFSSCLAPCDSNARESCISKFNTDGGQTIGQLGHE